MHIMHRVNEYFIYIKTEIELRTAIRGYLLGGTIWKTSKKLLK